MRLIVTLGILVIANSVFANGVFCVQNITSQGQTDRWVVESDGKNWMRLSMYDGHRKIYNETDFRLSSKRKYRKSYVLVSSSELIDGDATKVKVRVVSKRASRRVHARMKETLTWIRQQFGYKSSRNSQGQITYNNNPAVEATCIPL